MISISPAKNIGGGGSMISEPHNRGAPWCYPSPTKLWGGGVLNDIIFPPKYLGVSMISEIHPNIEGGQWYLSPTKLLGGSMTSEPHLNIFLGAQWYLSPVKGYWGAQWYLSTTKILGRLNDIRAPPTYWGGGAKWYPRSTQNMGGGLNDIWAPPKILGGGLNDIWALPKYIWVGGLNDMRDPMSEPPPPPQINIYKILIWMVSLYII